MAEKAARWGSSTNFTANTREKNFDEMKQEFEQIMKTVEIEK